MVLYFIRYLDLCQSRNIHLKDLNKQFLWSKFSFDTDNNNN
jgi:hypothetical protein